jgi:BolA family transcriptional regulator, general stress-responsive regulator
MSMVMNTKAGGAQGSTHGSVGAEIVRRLASLNPAIIELDDESSKHAHHEGAAAHRARTGMAASDMEGTHFELTIVSSAFEGKPLIARHRMVYALLDDLMKTRIHALKIDARAA